MLATTAIVALALVMPAPFPPQASMAHVSRAGQRLRPLTLSAEKSPFGAIFGALASALETVLDAAFPGQVELIDEAESIIRADERAVNLIGPDASIGKVDPLGSTSVTAGVQLQCTVSGSRGSGVAIIGGARNDDDGGDNSKLDLQILRLQVGDEDFYLVEP